VLRAGWLAEQTLISGGARAGSFHARSGRADAAQGTEYALDAAVALFAKQRELPLQHGPEQPAAPAPQPFTATLLTHLPPPKGDHLPPSSSFP